VARNAHPYRGADRFRARTACLRNPFAIECDQIAVEVMRLTLWFLAVLLVLVGAMAWISDSITLQGERTIYTVRCIDGEWKDEQCTGHLVAAERYRFRALRAHREVLFWTVGSSNEPSGKFSDCEIQDGRNWKCAPSPDTSRSITLQIARGFPVPDAAGRTRGFHAVPKWKWMMLPAAH
jgi:hypothetical protein